MTKIGAPLLNADTALETLAAKDYEVVNEPFPGTIKPWKVRCRGCRELKEIIFKDVARQRRDGCAACALRAKPPRVVPVAKSRSVPQQEAERRLRAAGYEPLGPYPGSNKRPWPAVCQTCGTHAAPTLLNVRHSRCRRCADSSRRLRWSELEASKVMAQSGFETLVPFPAAGRPWRSRCTKCTHESFPRLSDVLKGTGCSWCQGVHILDEENSLQIMRRHGYRVLEPYKNVHSPWRSQCLSCLLISSPTLHAVRRKSNASGCRFCSTTTKDFGYLYLVRFPDHGVFKVGISSAPLDRLRNLSSTGGAELELVRLFGPLPIVSLRAAEDTVLLEFKELAAPANTMKSLSGKTETFHETDISVDFALSTIERILNAPVGSLDDGHVLEIPSSTARDFISTYHYSKTAARGRYHFGLFIDGVLVGAASFGLPTYAGTGSSVRSEGNLVELRRFVLAPQTLPNAASFLLSRALKLLPKDIDMVVAFSDPNVGHHGGIYQAANFVFTGMSGQSYHYEAPDGRYIHKRLPWNAAKRDGVSERDAALAQGLTRVEDAPKYRYAYGRTRQARKSLVPLAFPKPDEAVA